MGTGLLGKACANAVGGVCVQQCMAATRWQCCNTGAWCFQCRWLMAPNPGERPSAREVLASDLLPPRLEDEQVRVTRSPQAAQRWASPVIALTCLTTFRSVLIVPSISMLPCCTSLGKLKPSLTFMRLINPHPPAAQGPAALPALQLRRH